MKNQGSKRTSSRASVEGSVPLAVRLRNPPPAFVGRAREAEMLQRKLGRGRVVAVVGPAGIGKTAMVLHVVHGLGPAAVARSFSFSASAGRDLVRDVLEALREASEETSVRRRADATVPLAQVLDLADRLQATILIEDAHAARADEVQTLLSAAASYARASRWIVTSRGPVDAAGLEGQTVTIGAMPVRELAALASALCAEIAPASARAAAEEAEGSPLWLKHRLGLGSSREREAVLSELSAAARVWVDRLASFEVPLPPAAIAGVGGLGFEAVAKELEQRGLVTVTEEGVRLHAVVRALAPAGAASREIARELASSGAPAAVVEACRLLLACTDLDGALSLVGQHSAAILASGLSARLWAVLERVVDPRFVGVKLECATDLGGGAALEWALALPPPGDLHHRLAWCTALSQAGRLAAAAERADELALGAGDPSLRFGALFLAVRCCVTLGRAKDALDRIETARPLATSDHQVSLDLWAARAHAISGNDRAALELAARIEPEADALPPTVRREVEIQRAIVFTSLGRMKSARAAFDRAGAPGLLSLEQRGMQRRVVREAQVAVELGRLDETRRLLDALEPYAARSVELAILTRAIELRHASAMGESARAKTALELVHRDATAIGSVFWRAWLPAATHYLAILCGAPFDAKTAATPEHFAHARAMAALHEVVSLGTTRRLDREPATEAVDAAIVLRIASSRAALLAGDFVRARHDAKSAITLADAEGLVLWAGDARVALVEALLLAGNTAVDEELGALAEVMERTGAARLRAEVAFFREAVRGAEADTRVFDELARTGDTSISAARRSRALFGFEEALDRVDCAIVSELQARVRLGRVGTARAYRPGLLLDPRRTRARLPDGSDIDLATKPLSMRLLVTLFERGGGATKAQLVRAAWGRSDYHPLRDDKRLQVAMGRLRAALGDDPSNPRLIDTTTDGYRFSESLLIHAKG